MDERQWLECSNSAEMLHLVGEKLSERKCYLLAAAFLRRFWHLMADDRSRRAVEAMERYADGQASWHALRRAQGAAKRAWERLWSEEEAKGLLQGSFFSGSIAVAYYAAGIDVEIDARYPWPETKGTGPRPHLGLFALGAAPHHYASDPYDYSDEPAWRTLICPVPPERLGNVPHYVWDGDAIAIARERGAQAEILRDLMGSPFSAVSWNPTSLGGNEGLVVRLAQAAYDERQLPSGILDPARLAVFADALEEAGCEDANVLEHLRSPGPHYRGCHVLEAVLAKE